MQPKGYKLDRMSEANTSLIFGKERVINMLEIKENLYREIDEMDIYELLLLYNQIRLMKNIKTKKKLERKETLDLEEIHKLTSSSKSDWAKSLISEREERI